MIACNYLGGGSVHSSFLQTFHPLLPPSDFACFVETADADDDAEVFDVLALLMPNLRFPSGSLVARLQQLTGKKAMAIEKGKQRRKRTKLC